MRIRQLKLLFFSFLLILHYTPAGAQAGPGTGNKAVSPIHSMYWQVVGESSSLYTGIVYERYWTGIKGHPFFLGDQFVPGSVSYQGTDYESIPLLYDMSRDQLVTRSFSGELSLELLREKIKWFSIGPHRFINIIPDSSSAIRPGFYELLYNRSIMVLAKRENRVVRVTRREDEPGQVSADKQFLEYDDFYVLRNGQYSSISSEADLVSLLKDRRAEIRKFLNRRDTSYRKDPAAAIVAAVSYYEQLKN